jgi:hypothetical protein
MHITIKLQLLEVFKISTGVDDSREESRWIVLLMRKEVGVNDSNYMLEQF